MKNTFFAAIDLLHASLASNVLQAWVASSRLTLAQPKALFAQNVPRASEALSTSLPNLQSPTFQRTLVGHAEHVCRRAVTRMAHARSGTRTLGDAT